MKSYELKFSLQAGCRKIVRSDKPCRIEFHIETLQSSLVGLSAKHAHLYQDPSLRETGFRKWLKIFNYFLCYNISCLDIVCANLILFS